MPITFSRAEAVRLLAHAEASSSVHHAVGCLAIIHRLRRDDIVTALTTGVAPHTDAPLPPRTVRALTDITEPPTSEQVLAAWTDLAELVWRRDG